MVIRPRLFVTVVLTLFGLSGCGGGGDDGSSNLPPLTSGFCGTTPQEAALTGILPGIDPDNTPGGLIFALNADGSGGTGPIMTAKGQVEIIDPTTGAFSYTPNAHPARRGTDTIAYQVADTAGGTTSGEMSVIINPRILTLGDSITQGIVTAATPIIPDREGYRKMLQDQLLTNGFGFDLIGDRTDLGNNIPGFDFETESYAGAMALEIANGGGDIDDEAGVTVNYTGIFDALEQNPADIVLLHIGTNDIEANLPNPTPPNDVITILTEIDRWEDSNNGNPVAVVLARIIDKCINFGTGDCGPGEPLTAQFNNSVAANAAALNPDIRPDEIIFVDQRSVLLNGANQPDHALYGNNLHPNPTGYSRMATAWHNSLTNVMTGPAIFEKCP